MDEATFCAQDAGDIPIMLVTRYVQPVPTPALRDDGLTGVPKQSPVARPVQVECDTSKLCSDASVMVSAKAQ